MISLINVRDKIIHRSFPSRRIIYHAVEDLGSIGMISWLKDGVDEVVIHVLLVHVDLLQDGSDPSRGLGTLEDEKGDDSLQVIDRIGQEGSDR